MVAKLVVSPRSTEPDGRAAKSCAPIGYGAVTLVKPRSAPTGPVVGSGEVVSPKSSATVGVEVVRPRSSGKPVKSCAMIGSVGGAGGVEGGVEVTTVEAYCGVKL